MLAFNPLHAALAICLLLSPCATAHAQSNRAALTGTLSDSLRGAPVAGVEILLYKGNFARAAAISDADGRYTITARPDTYALEARLAQNAVGFTGRFARIDTVDLRQDATLDLRMPALYAHTGRVLDPQGRPVPHLRAGPEPAGHFVDFTDAEGRYALRLPAGDYVAHVGSPWVAQRFEIAVAADAVDDLHLRDRASRHFAERTLSHLPVPALGDLSMDARPVDVDSDGDLDLVVASEFKRNILLLNDGQGRFADASLRLPDNQRDSEDIAAADLDSDGDPDIVVVTEVFGTNELYLNDGFGFFTDASARLPVAGTSEAAQLGDVDGDGDQDLLIGNAGDPVDADGVFQQNALLLNDGQGFFTDATQAQLPRRADSTQDLELGDPDNDGDLDLIAANNLLAGEAGYNRLLLNDGQGFFTDASAARLPYRALAEETFEADFGDVDSDGDLDLYFANFAVMARQQPQHQDRLLLNDGQGFFTDATAARLPPVLENTYDADFVDLDSDGDLDLVTGHMYRSGYVAPPAEAPRYRAYLNDGQGFFADRSADVFPAGLVGNGFDIEAADYDGDGRVDLYLCNRGGLDRLLFGRGPQATAVQSPRAAPDGFALLGNYPNPFNAATLIAYALPQRAHVRLTVYNSAGQKIRRLVDAERGAGRHQVRWRGDDERGQPVASGVYFYVLASDHQRLARRLALIK